MNSPRSAAVWVTGIETENSRRAIGVDRDCDRKLDKIGIATKNWEERAGVATTSSVSRYK